MCAKLLVAFLMVMMDRQKIAIAFFCVFCNWVTSMKAASAGAVLGDRIIAFFLPDKARRRGGGSMARQRC